MALGPTPYAWFHTAFDPLLTAGARNYWKPNNFKTLSDAALDLIITTSAELPGAAPHANGGGYVNFLTDDETERVVASYGANRARLQALKQRYDPVNLFRVNLNITPAAAQRLG